MTACELDRCHCIKNPRFSLFNFDLSFCLYPTDTLQAMKWMICPVAGMSTGKQLCPTLTFNRSNSTLMRGCSDGVCPVRRLTKDGFKTCLTCALKEGACRYNSAYFSHNGSFYQMSCRGSLRNVLSHVRDTFMPRNPSACT